MTRGESARAAALPWAVVGKRTGRRYRTLAAQTVGAMTAATITAGCGPATTTVAGSAVTATPTQTRIAMTPRPAGAEVRDGRLVFVLLDTARARRVGDLSNPGLSLDAKGEFFVATVAIRNRGPESVTFFDRDQTLIDANGTVFSTNMAADIYANPNVHSTKMAAGAQLVVNLVFDVPVGTKPARLVLRESNSSPGAAVQLH